MWPPGLNPEPKQATPDLTVGGCPFRTQQCARPPGEPDGAVYDVSTHELRHHAFGGVAALARPAPLQGDLGEMLLRKEVIQPHLPVRLPCYDFVPIASPTFDHSLPRVGPWASGVTDFRDVTGGVYKARERIHRSVADLRLLATPTS